VEKGHKIHQSRRNKHWKQNTMQGMALREKIHREKKTMFGSEVRLAEAERKISLGARVGTTVNCVRHWARKIN
jgi:hypothetical protein